MVCRKFCPGTGALRLAAEFIKRFLPGAFVYCSNPTWGNHQTVLEHAGVEHKEYRYWDAKNRALDINGLVVSGSVQYLCKK
jgi:aspartate/tyrosine/aromatic aminotransferase